MKYLPHEYQTYATDFILTHPVAAILLDMGLGKSVITLTAIHELCLNRFEVSRVLVVAPLRVARDTWPAEIQKWDHLKGLTYSVAVGTAEERRAAIRENAMITIINRENVQWLVEESGASLDYDMIVIDELSGPESVHRQGGERMSAANPEGVRFKKLPPETHAQAKRRAWGGESG
jgi:superfamily II DNA or RNA helicase